MADHDEMISHFKDVTGVDSERAEFFLESHDWQLDVALASFFEGDGVEQIDDMPEEIELDDDSPSEASKDSNNVKMKPFPKSKPKFGTLRDLENKDNSSSEDEEGQAFYAGGSTNSGQQILGPGKKDIVGDMFKSCQKQSVPPPEHSRSSHQNRPNTFTGTGYKLGMTSNDTEVVATPSQSSGRRESTGLIVLKLWQNGFTINDGELKVYTDPENREFLDAIKNGEIPEEIRQEFKGVELHLDMEDHRHEEYIPPKTKVKAFTGKGQMLGSPSPAASGMTIPSDPADQAANEAMARSQLNLDSSQPLTTIQIRLADGSNVRVQFNLTHTIEDVRRFITTMRPQYALREFTLQTTYPTKELADGTKTIEESNLQNAAIMQRLK